MPATTSPVSLDTTYDATVLLADGSLAEVRSLGADDRAELLRLHASGSDESIYRRFFGMNRSLGISFVDHVCAEGSASRCLLALRGVQVVGLVSAEPVGPTTVEVSAFVDESMHGRGVATALLEHVALWLGREGVTTFVADVLTVNNPMLRVFFDAGFAVSHHRDEDVVRLTMDVRATTESAGATDARERHAEQLSLSRLFEPRSVAVVGVSRSPGGIGREVVTNIVSAGFDGQVYAIGQAGLTIPGAVACVDLAEASEPVDLVIIAVPAPRVLAAVRAAAESGAHVCVILTAGLGEAGDAGKETERAAMRVAREHGMRLVGPNCFGVLSTLRGSRLNATFGQQLPLTGSLAIGSQSGGVGVALLDASRRRALGVACFASLGNKIDVSGNDLLAAWTDDEDVAVAALYLESFGNPRKFARIARTLGRRKPLLAIFGGSSDAGHRGGTSHTAASATPQRALGALFRAAGLVEVDGISDLVATAALFVEQPLPAGPRVGVVGNAGGLGILAADSAQREGLHVPELSTGLRAALAGAVPGLSGTSNPVDLGAAASPEGFRSVVELMLASDEIDAVLVVAVDTAVTDLDGIVSTVDDSLAESHTKPCLGVVLGGSSDRPAGATTRFDSVEAAARSLGHVLCYAEWLRTPEPTLALPAIGTNVAEAVPYVAPLHVSGWLDATAAADLLAGRGVQVAAWSVLTDPGDADVVGARLGYPVVAKIASGDAVHKTELGMIRTGLRDAAALAAAVADIQTLAGPAAPVLVQQQLSGAEIAVGIVRDDRFGPLVMVASGGVAMELWSDQVFLMPPFADLAVLDALRSLRTWRLLTGFRGGRRGDVDALVDLVQRVGQLALTTPEVLELDLNPVIVTPDAAVCVDAKVRWLAPE